MNVRDIHFIYFNVATNEFVPFFLLQVTCTAQPRSIIGGKRLEKEIGRKKWNELGFFFSIPYIYVYI